MKSIKVFLKFLINIIQTYNKRKAYLTSILRNGLQKEQGKYLSKELNILALKRQDK